MAEMLFTPASVLDLLTQIDELSEYEVGITQELNGQFQLTVGNSVYSIADDAKNIVVEESVVDDISDVNLDTYEMLSEQGEVDLFPIESGVIKEITKTLLVGGLVRLTKKLLK